MKKDKFQDIVILSLIIGIFYLFYRSARYSIIVPNEHVLGTEDDAIQLTGGKSVSPLLTESVTYELIDTLAKLKGAQDASELLVTDFHGRSIPRCHRYVEKYQRRSINNNSYQFRRGTPEKLMFLLKN